jgi:hypothetical protein
VAKENNENENNEISESVSKYHEIMYQASENGENGMAWYRKMIIGSIWRNEESVASAK